MKIVLIAIALFIIGCSENPRILDTRLDFSELDGSASNSIHSYLKAEIKIKKDRDSMMWALDIVEPKYFDAPERDVYVKHVVLHWLKNPDKLEKMPHINIDFVDKDGFIIKNSSTEGKIGSSEKEMDEENGVTTNRFRTQGSFPIESSKFNSISSCNLKIISNNKSLQALKDLMAGSLEDFDKRNPPK